MKINNPRYPLNYRASSALTHPRDRTVTLTAMAAFPGPRSEITS